MRVILSNWILGVASFLIMMSLCSAPSADAETYKQYLARCEAQAKQFEESRQSCTNSGAVCAFFGCFAINTLEMASGLGRAVCNPVYTTRSACDAVEDWDRRADACANQSCNPWGNDLRKVYDPKSDSYLYCPPPYVQPSIGQRAYWQLACGLNADKNAGRIYGTRLGYEGQSCEQFSSSSETAVCLTKDYFIPGFLKLGGPAACIQRGVLGSSVGRRCLAVDDSGKVYLHTCPEGTIEKIVSSRRCEMIASRQQYTSIYTTCESSLQKAFVASDAGSFEKFVRGMKTGTFRASGSESIIFVDDAARIFSLHSSRGTCGLPSFQFWIKRKKNIYHSPRHTRVFLDDFEIQNGGRTLVVRGVGTEGMTGARKLRSLCSEAQKGHIELAGPAAGLTIHHLTTQVEEDWE